MQWLLDNVGYIIYSALWYILVFLPAWILHIVYSTLEFIALKLPIFILFGGYKIDFTSTFFIRFFTIMAISLILVFGIVMYRFFKAQKDKENQLLFKESLKRGFLSGLIMIGIPILIWLMMVFFTIIYQFIKSVLLNSQDNSITSFLFQTLEPSWENTSLGHQDWIAVKNTYLALNFKGYQNLRSSSILLILELCISFLAILWVMLNLFLRIVKIVAFEFIYLLWLPPAVAQGTNDAGETLKKWFTKFFECILSTFIILVVLILFLFLIETTFKQVPLLITDIIGDPKYEVLKDIVSAILSIGILIGMTFGIENMVTRLMFFFNLDQFAQGTNIKLRKKANASNNNNKRSSKSNNQKGIQNDKNVLKKDNLSKTIATKNQKINNKNNNISSNKTSSVMKPWFVKLFDALKGLKKDNVTSKTTKKNKI
ncbi:Uncharacterised protein [Mycoplasmopsis maculosa]|uniref:Uncharacterized protein n=1 Tax=Mycoplasmopsis maculosa TaxID=114885 RepID=A0A449B3W2_9BACT|nr:hypothetical protein [Mycoplasmopsis maculosa]VEU75294.1 Uncharacterised protein [Mycoplasmopsis maculosa]